MDLLSTIGNKISNSDYKANVLDGLGNVAKGYFLIPTYDVGRNIDGDFDEKKIEAASEKSVKSILKKAEDRLKANKKITASSTSMQASDYVVNDDVTFFTYEVQYNPASIKIRTTSGQQFERYVGVQGDNKISSPDMGSYTTLEVKLIFEDINNSDAFSIAGDGISLTGGIVPAASNLINKNAVNNGLEGAKENYSVRKNVEGFLAIMSRMAWRNITFFYGRTCFHGQLVSINSQYKLFNPAGEPILAEMTVSIRQDSGENKTDDEIWMKSYEAVCKNHTAPKLEG